MKEEMIRSFIALDFDSEAKDFLNHLVLQWKKNYPQAKWLRKEHFHITLTFFKALPTKDINPIEELLKKMSEEFSSFSIEFNKVNVFPSWERVRVLWIGCNEEGEKKIQKIVKALIEGLQKKGIFIEEEKEFSPHITLARFRSPLPLFAADWRLEHSFCTVLKKLVFFQSTLTPQGPIYKELFVSHLKG